jgi:uncharacterized lipoprotein YddW (UPF0748 family)
MMEKIRQAGPVAALVLAILLAAQMVVVPSGPGGTSSGGIAPVDYVFQDSTFKAVWIPYMSLDLSRTAQKHFGTFKAMFDQLLDEVVRAGANTVIVHVRPFGDALYRSSLFPWSHLLTGQQGQDPGYDPLAYMVEAAHKAGLKIHAWINPLRLRSAETPSQLAANNVHSKWRGDSDPKNDDWTVVTDTGTYLNPGRAEVRDYIIAGVSELVSNYDVDGVHLDDYFYPTQAESFDRAAHQAHCAAAGTDALSLSDWRKDNINRLISGMYRAVKDCREDLLFGISPQGNLDNCEKMYADVPTWATENGYVDYLCPQLYYPYEGSALPFAETAVQWQTLVTAPEVALYGGLALYKAGSTSADNGAWTGCDDMIRRQLYTLNESGYDGFALYSSQYLTVAQTEAEMEAVRECLGVVGEKPASG